MLQSDELPLAEVIDGDQWQAVFDQHQIEFGNEPDAIYTPALTLWALISQAFFKAEMRSCLAAVARVSAWWAARGRVVSQTNTGAYCRARAKISWQALRDICCQVARRAESVFDDQDTEYEKPHGVVERVREVPTSGAILLVDGFTITAADTPENQAEFPQNPVQKEGLGFPIIRGVSLISMMTGLLIALELGPYAGKLSGETALLWKMLEELKPGDIRVMNDYVRNGSLDLQDPKFDLRPAGNLRYPMRSNAMRFLATTAGRFELRPAELSCLLEVVDNYRIQSVLELVRVDPPRHLLAPGVG